VQRLPPLPRSDEALPEHVEARPDDRELFGVARSMQQFELDRIARRDLARLECAIEPLAE